MNERLKGMHSESKIFVAGHRGMVGSALLRTLTNKGFKNIVTRTRDRLDLARQEDVHAFFEQERFDFVFLAAAKVGGIEANRTFPADFLYENLVIATNVIHAAAVSDVQKLLFLGSSCIYPRNSSQPIRESALLTGPLEATNEGYAIAKIAGLKLCQFYMKQYGKRFISAMPTNLYGIGDNFHPRYSHVIPALIRRFHEAKVQALGSVEVWGSGTPIRDFLNVDDLSDALLLLMQNYEEMETINIGTGEGCTIRELTERIAGVVGYQAKIEFNPNYPDGTPKKVLDVTRIQNLKWAPKIPLEMGLRKTYQWALESRVL